MFSTSAFSKIHEFETTHLKSTGGTGVGTLFAEESAFLNPASLSFSNTSTVYVQKDSDKLTEGGVDQAKPKSLGFVFADGNPSLSGSLSYVDQHEDDIIRKRWGLSLSTPVSDGKSSFGVSVRSTKDENTVTQEVKKYYQTVFGVNHAIDEKFTIGIVAYDPFKSKGHETKALVGLQYTLMNYITAAVDFGGDYTADSISKTLIYKGSMQFKVLDDFYLRFGGFNDKLRAEKGNGFGLGWVQPRLTFEFAIKNTTRDKSLTLNQDDAKFKETSFAASIRF